MGRTFLVTGGAGFVGMAVVKLLAKETIAGVSHVKVLDLRIPDDLKKNVERDTKGPTFEWIVCDITDRSSVFEAIKGCDVVLHVASVIPGAFNDDRDTMWKVNVTGAKHIVDACRECDVGGLVYVSSISIIGPNFSRKPIYGLTEDTPYDPRPRSYYGEAKKAAEEYILATNSHEHASGKALFTCSLRPFVIYGQTFEQTRLTYKSALGGSTIYSLCDEDSKTSSVYVGNLAYAIITAGKQIEDKGHLVGGEFYYIKDDTPEQHLFNIYASVFSVVGLSLSKEPFIPFVLAYILYWIAFLLMRFVKYLGLTNVTLPAPEYLWRLNTKCNISCRKFTEHFDFKPKFSPEHAISSIREYIVRLNENGFEKPVYDFEY